MVTMLILGALAGWLAPMAEPHVKRLIEEAAMAETPLQGAELRTLAFAVCLLIAAILGWLVSDGGAVALALGAALGVFAPRLLARVRGK